MSLVMMALRIAAVEALKLGNTLVGTNVLDSQISAIDQTADGQLQSDQQRPFIAVYSDAAKTDDLGKTGLRSNGHVELMFNCGVSLTMGETNKETGATEIVEGFPSTDAQFEAILDVVGCQICRTLTDAENPWAQVFLDLGSLVSKAQVRSSSSVEGVRLACGQIKLTINAYADPPLGQALVAEGPWARLLALMAEYEVKQLGFVQMLLGDAVAHPYPDYEALTGMSVEGAKSMKLYSWSGVGSDVVIDDVSAVVEQS